MRWNETQKNKFSDQTFFGWLRTPSPFHLFTGQVPIYHNFIKSNTFSGDWCINQTKNGTLSEPYDACTDTVFHHMHWYSFPSHALIQFSVTCTDTVFRHMHWYCFPSHALIQFSVTCTDTVFRHMHWYSFPSFFRLIP